MVAVTGVPVIMPAVRAMSVMPRMGLVIGVGTRSLAVTLVMIVVAGVRLVVMRVCCVRV
ncbi:hypothetical protein [Brevibacterium luteolum]|uniref:hypothetical protein n=1 Tax=Brevibacterium luteolum TaxID=199591 RepID=UPI00387A7D6E